jgi:hypothetical protein
MLPAQGCSLRLCLWAICAQVKLVNDGPVTIIIDSREGATELDTAGANQQAKEEEKARRRYENEQRRRENEKRRAEAAQQDA